MAYLAEDTVVSDPTSRNLEPETLPLEEVIDRLIAQAGLRLRVALPCVIVAVEADQTVDLQPLLKVRYAGRPPSLMPVLRSCPVLMPMGADWRVSYPLAVGDTGMALVADRNMDAWLAGTGAVADPADTRAHDLNDAVFCPGLVPDALNTRDTSTDLVLANGSASLRLQKNGHLKVNNTAQELVAVLDKAMTAQIQLIQQLQAGQVLTPFGPSPFLASTIAAFQQTQASLQSIQKNIQTFLA